MDFVKKHLTTIISIVAIVALFLPFATASAEVAGVKAPGVTVTGFHVSFLLVVGPALLIVKNFIPSLGKYSKIVSLAIPALSIIIFFISMMTYKDPASAALGSLGKTHVSWGIGAFIALICYIASLVLGLLENKLIPEKYIPKK